MSTILVQVMKKQLTFKSGACVVTPSSGMQGFGLQLRGLRTVAIIWADVHYYAFYTCCWCPQLSAQVNSELEEMRGREI